MQSRTLQNPQALLRMGETLMRQGRPEQAEPALRQVIQVEPHNAQALEYLGGVELARNNAGKAAGWLRRAIEYGGGSIPRHNNLGTALYMLNRMQEAVREYEKAVELDPDNSAGYMGIGRCLLQIGDYERAGGCFQKVEANDPEDLQALIGQVHCYYFLNYVPQAIRACQKALEIDPENKDMKLCYGQLLEQQGHFQEAVEYLEPMMADPEYREKARPNLIQVLIHLGDMERVEALAREGLEQGSAFMENMQSLARALNAQGRAEEAQSILEDLVSRPGMTGGWLQLQGLRDLTEEEIEVVRRQYQALPEDAKAGRGALAFVMAGYHEKRKERAEQMEWLHVANAAIAETRYFDPANTQDYTARLRERFTRDSFPEMAAAGDPDFEPVFILGLPRSGTTLLEQILGAHPELTPAGENPIMPWVFRQEVRAGKASGIHRLTPENIGAMAERYRAYMDERYTDGRIVEKGIANAREAGLLYALFPNARFVEIRRHPLDVALGCYKQFFASQNFSYTIDYIAHEIRLHEDMMAYWHQEMPVPIHTVQYEELVTAQDDVTREVLDYLELPFDPACLTFHENRTKVATASINQVRQGIYTTAVGKWQAYGELLDPFREAFHEHGVHIPGEDD